jgi:FxsC-like protein
MWFGQLYQDLCEHIVELTDLDADTPAGFMDRDMRSGEEWSDRLAGSLATCRVFVPLFSPRYFNSVQCGKEWCAFAQRAVRQQARSNRATEAIVPALWVPVDPHRLPNAAERLQFNHNALGDAYTTEGLYGLIKLKMFRREYELAVYELAKRIVKVAESEIVSAGQPVDYRRIPSAFGDPNGPRALRIAVAAGARGRLPQGRNRRYYGDGPADWNPFVPSSSRPLAAVTADLARSFDFEPTVVSLDEEPSPARIAVAPAEGPEILLIDRWVVTDAAWRERLGALDAARPWTALVVAWNREDPQSRDVEDELRSRLERIMPNTSGHGPPACRTAARGVHSLESLTDILPQVVEWAAAQYRGSAPAYPPDGPRVERVRLFHPGAPSPSAFPRGAPPPDTPDDTEESR